MLQSLKSIVDFSPVEREREMDQYNQIKKRISQEEMNKILVTTIR
jgi:hypothetical protein